MVCVDPFVRLALVIPVVEVYKNHHQGSRVQFRNLFVKRTGAAAAAGKGK